MVEKSHKNIQIGYQGKYGFKVLDISVKYIDGL